jgi:sulfotransferase family protein
MQKAADTRIPLHPVFEDPRWQLRRLRRVLRRPIVAWRHADLSSSDVIIGSYPRSGSNWLSMMVGELLLGKEIDFHTRPFPAPFITNYRGAPGVLAGGGRLIKTHERWRPDYERAVYLVRHPVDVAASYYAIHGALGLPAPRGFVRALVRGWVDSYGTWSENVEGWLDCPAQVHLVRYECLVEETLGTLAGTMEFLGMTPTPAALERAVENNSLERMQAKLESLRRSLGRSGKAMPARTRLGEAEVELIERHAKRVMDRLGYESRRPALA